MKIKLTVLALLVVGLTVGMSGSALADITLGASTPVGAAVDIPNASSEFAILAFSATGDAADDAISVFDFAEGAAAALSGGLTAADVISDMNVYVDAAPVGSLGAEDTIVAGTYTAGTLTYTPTAPEAIGVGAVNFIVGATLSGAAPTGDDIAIDTANGNFTNSGAGAIVAADEAGNAMTVEALEVTVYTQDFSGPPYSRPNGYIDALRLVFDVDGTATAIDDATVDDADFTLVGHVIAAFSATAHGDAADNSEIFLDYDEIAADITSDTPNYTYTAGTRILSADGEYGLADVAATATTDGAAPAPRSVTTLDADGNGKIDTVNIQFSEELANDTVITGVTFPGLTIASAAEAAGAGDFAGVNSLWVLTITEGASYNTGITPQYSYDTSLNTLQDAAAAPNQVASFNYLNVPVTDGAAPTVVAAKTMDNDDDGKFDTLDITFSENVAIKGGSTADDLDAALITADGFFFDELGGYNTTYTFADTGHSLAGNVLSMKVNELGSFDTAVQPNIQYLNAAANLIRDLASTPNILAAANPFVNVTSASAVTNAAQIWMQDGISARVTNGTWLDGSAKTGTTQNGKLDTVSLTFSEPMGLTTTTYSALSIAGHAIIASVVEGATVYVRVDETGYDTGDTPDVTYTGTTIVDINNAKLMALDSADITELDGAYPVLYEAATLDMGYGAGEATGVHNGQIDGVRLRFSEDMDLDNLDADLETEFGVNGYVVVDTLIINAADEFVLQLTESGASDTDQTPDVVYTDDGANPLLDMNALVFQDIALTELTSVDRAPAAVLSVTTKDANLDGYLDGALVAFSEAVSVADSAAARGGVSLSEEENAIDLTAATITAPLATQLLFVGTSEMGDGDWDTGELPDLSIAAGNGIADAVGNIVAEVDDVASVDGAAPVFGKAVGQVSSTDIAITFTESVTNDAGAAVDQTDVLYYSTRNGYSITAIAAGGSGALWDATTDTMMTYDDVTMDQIRLVAGSVKDAAGNLAPADTIGISDVVSPTLTGKEAYDLNNDGWIDNIKLIFSENINEQNLLGYSADFDTMVAHDSGLDSVWTLEHGVPHPTRWWQTNYYSDRYDLVGINLTEDSGDASAAHTEMRYHMVLKSTDPVTANVGDVKGDNVIWLMVKAKDTYKTGLWGDTGNRIYVTMEGGSVAAGGAGLGDFSPNYSTGFSRQRATDKCPPMLQFAYMPEEEHGYIMKAYFSEPLKSSLPAASGVFAWLVGTEEIDYAAAGYIVNFRQDPDSTQLYYIESNMPVLKNTAASLDYSGAGVIQDAENVWNTMDGSAASVGEWEGIGVEEEDETDVPDVFALSKNFPNPFNPSTTINYDIAGAGGHTSLVIYNMAGQKVRTLVDEAKAPGFYSVVWDGTDDQGLTVASGIYLYRIVSGDFNANEKMTFIK